MPLPEDRGGFGGTPVETMILMEAFGTGLVLEPFVPTVVPCEKKTTSAGAAPVRSTNARNPAMIPSAS